jgi:hypothetical protein
LFRYFINDFEMVPVAHIITGITFVFTFHMRCISIARSLYLKIFSASFLITFLFNHIWRRLHNKELYAVYSSPNIIRVIKSRRMRWAGHVACMGERRGALRALVGKPEGRRQLVRPRRRREDNIKMGLREFGWGA